MLIVTMLFAGVSSIQAQELPVNYDEDKVGDIRLPDPLLLDNGQRIVTAGEWKEKGYPSILQKFAQHVYGKYPGATPDLYFKVNSIDPRALNGQATRKEITIFFTKKLDSPSMDVLLYLPNQVKGPVPVFIGLNYFGNQSISHDPGISLSTRWMRRNDAYHIVDNHATEGTRGIQASRWPLAEILGSGYGVATAYYGDLEPDHAEGWKTGIRTTLLRELATTPDEWGALGAWGWGLSRMMDYLETDGQVKPDQVIITGHSRLGKAALWAAVNDQRFSIVISNDSGEGGAALARRNYGETIAMINKAFPHWFSSQYKSYNDDPDKLPVDQHMLLALMAPRPLYVASAEDDQWADPKGEFLSAVHAEPVYRLFGKKGIGQNTMPSIEQPVGETIRYHIRRGKHDITHYDWLQYIDFANQHFNYPPK